MNRSTSMMLPSTNIIFHLINVVIFLKSFLKTKSYLMAPLESIQIKKFTLTLNLELSQCITALILFLTYTDKPLKRNLTTWLSWVFLNHAEPLSGHPQPSLFLKKMVASVKLQIFIHLTRLSFVNNTIYESSQTCLIASQVINSLLN